MSADASSTIALQGTLTGGLALSAATGSWVLEWGDIDGGTYTASGGAELVFTRDGGTLDGVTAASDLDLNRYGTGGSNYTAVTIVDGLTLDNASIILGDNTGAYFGVLGLVGDQTLSVANGATGSVVFGTNPSNNINVESGTLTIANEINVHGSQGTISGAGTVVNDGNIDADGGGAIAVTVSTLTNNGTLAAAPGGTLNVTSALTNFVGGTLTGGGLLADGGSVNIPNSGGVLTTNAANLGFDAAGASITVGGQNVQATLMTNAAAGDLIVFGGAAGSFTAAGGLSNAGTVNVGDGSSFATPGGFTQSGGSTRGPWHLEYPGKSRRSRDQRRRSGRRGHDHGQCRGLGRHDLAGQFGRNHGAVDPGKLHADRRHTRVHAGRRHCGDRLWRGRRDRRGESRRHAGCYPWRLILSQFE